MSYYTALNLEKEPFSTSPDPVFFYRSVSHDSALKRLEIAIRLKRGLSLVLGDVGTGKTTLSRTLLQSFATEDNFIFHMILDPGCDSEFQFLTALIKVFGLSPEFRSALEYKDAIERYLFQKGVTENKTVVLLIDEGQKLNMNQIETLRTLLNFETNEYKLLQLVIFSQTELLPRLKKVRNFTDRVALKYLINPLDEDETKAMILFRLRQAGYDSAAPIFTDEAIKLIYEQTQGYPRQIALLCHDCLEALIMTERRRVDYDLVSKIIRPEVS